MKKYAKLKLLIYIILKEMRNIFLSKYKLYVVFKNHSISSIFEYTYLIHKCMTNILPRHNIS